MPKIKTTDEYIASLELINTWDELKAFESFARIKQCLRAKALSERSHRKAQAKNQAYLKIAKQMVKDGTLKLDI